MPSQKPNLTFNIFQRLTRQWDALHPYNAAQAMRLEGPAREADAQAAWQTMLQELKVGWAEVDGRHYAMGAPPTRADLPMVTAAVGSTLDEFISAQMNQPFSAAGGPIFRPFLLGEADSYWLGVIYHHWAADSASIRALLREWFLRMYEPLRARSGPFVPARMGYVRAVGPRAAGWDALGGLLDGIRWSSRFKSVRRMDRPLIDQIAGSGSEMHFSRHELPDGIVRTLRSAAKRQRATLNDLFLAMLAMASDRMVLEPERFRRHALALGSIVDLRARSRALMGQDPGDAFGLFLGFSNVIVRPQDLMSFKRLLSRIATQNRHNNRAKVPETGLLRLAAGVAAGMFMSGDALMEFYRKRLPLAAGISNVNMASSWVAAHHPGPILDYVRASPTGPMLPLVITPTTLGNRLHFGMTCRGGVFGPEARAAVVEAVCGRLVALAGEKGTEKPRS